MTIRNELVVDNPTISLIQLDIFASALATYHEALSNINKNGAICAHPRTGAPIENPYLKVRDQQAALLRNMLQPSKFEAPIKSDRVLQLVQNQ